MVVPTPFFRIAIGILFVSFSFRCLVLIVLYQAPLNNTEVCSSTIPKSNCRLLTEVMANEARTCNCGVRERERERADRSPRKPKFLNLTTVDARASPAMATLETRMFTTHSSCRCQLILGVTTTTANTALINVTNIVSSLE